MKFSFGNGLSEWQNPNALFTRADMQPDTDVPKISARYHFNIVPMVLVTLSVQNPFSPIFYSPIQNNIGLIFLNISVGLNIGTCEQGLTGHGTGHIVSWSFYIATGRGHQSIIKYLSFNGKQQKWLMVCLHWLRLIQRQIKMACI